MESVGVIPNRYKSYRRFVKPPVRIVPPKSVQLAPMNTTLERLAYLERLGKFRSRVAAAAAYGIPYETYKKIASPRASDARTLTPEHATAISNYHGTSPAWLLFGIGTPDGNSSVPLEGRIRGGGEMIVYETPEHERISTDLAVADARAFEVEGDSMMPLARDGDYAFFGPSTRDIQNLIGLECAVLLQDGRRLFKVIENGSERGRHDLISYNAETIRNVAVHSAGPFLGLRRASRLRRR